MQSNIDKLYSIKCGVASFLAKYAVAIFHPLDLIKIRFQSHDGTAQNHVPQYRGIIHGFKTIFKSEGLAGLYKGVHLGTFTSAFAGACFFWLYQKQKLNYQKEGYSPMIATSIAGTEASLFTAFITQPLWVIKTRVVLNMQRVGQIQNVKSKVLQIWREERAKGFAKGLSLNLFLSFGGAIRIYSYEGSKLLFQQFISKQNEGVKHLICGASSKVATTLLSFPFTTMRTRIQQSQYIGSGQKVKYKNISDVATQTLKKQGIFGFYKGIMPSIIRGIPMRSVYFYVYELLKQQFTNQKAIKNMKKSAQFQ